MNFNIISNRLFNINNKNIDTSGNFTYYFCNLQDFNFTNEGFEGSGVLLDKIQIELYNVGSTTNMAPLENKFGSEIKFKLYNHDNGYYAEYIFNNSTNRTFDTIGANNIYTFEQGYNYTDIWIPTNANVSFAIEGNDSLFANGGEWILSCQLIFQDNTLISNTDQVNYYVNNYGQEQFDKGASQGFEWGYNEGFNAGKLEGYGIGFEDGSKSNINTPISLMGKATEPVIKVLTTEIAPNMTIGSITMIPVTFAIITFLLKGLIL